MKIFQNQTNINAFSKFGKNDDFSNFGRNGKNIVKPKLENFFSQNPAKIREFYFIFGSNSGLNSAKIKKTFFFIQ